MRHTVEIKRTDGKKVKIEVTVWIDGFRSAQYIVSVYYCLPRKRTWISSYSTDDYSWRRLDGKGRSEYAMQKHLEHVTKEEIHNAKLELWNILKPKIENNGE